MESDNKRKVRLDSDDEDDSNDTSHSTDVPKLVFNLPPPVFGKAVSKGGLLDDDDEDDDNDDGNGNDEDDNDDPGDDSSEDQLEASQEEKETMAFTGQTTNMEPPNPSPPGSADAPSTDLLEDPLAKLPCDGSTRTVPNVDFTPVPVLVSSLEPQISSGLRRGALKTVHSGRSLSSHGSQKGRLKDGVKEVTETPSSKKHPPDPAPQNDKPNFLLRTVGVRPRFRSAQKQANGAPVNARAALFASRMATRRNRFGSVRGADGLDISSLNREATPSSQARRYKPDDYVLVCNHQSRWANLVNRHGFPPGEGATPEEQRGPYIYVLCTVKEVHFEEFAAYYTVDRCDTKAEQRADADFMEPLRSDRGKAAALRAATQLSAEDQGANGEYEGDGEGFDRTVDISNRAKIISGIQTCFAYMLLPFLWTFDFFYYYVGVSFLVPLWKTCLRHVRRQGRLILNGLNPYVCRVRLTMVNVIVLCSTWYMFIDQARLAFFPAEADDALAAVNLAVWLVLVLELVFQVFILPDGFKNLIVSDKAYAPTTVRFINIFHVCVESLSLIIFISEWYCLVSTYQCDDRLRFSFHNAVLLSVTGPTRLDSFYGKAFLALIRLRVFGLVRHWRNMWITNTFINMKWKSTPSGIVSNFIPQQRSSRSSAEHKSSSLSKKGNHFDDSQKRDINLANASTIGTALMVTNSYRALAILWVIMGLFPLLACVSSTFTNSMAPDMTSLLQATNLVASDTANATCSFLAQSVLAWMLGFTSPGFTQDSKAQYLVNLQITPKRCSVKLGDLSITEAACVYLERQAANKNTTINDPSRKSLDFFCDTWRNETKGTKSEIARELGLRTGSIRWFQEKEESNLTIVDINGTITKTELANYTVTSSFDESYTVRAAALCSLLLQLALLIMVLGGLSVLRRDAEVLVLKPLRHMLKIVARYAKNPLVPPKIKRRTSVHRGLSARLQADDTSMDSDDSDVTEEAERDYRKGQAGGGDDDLALGSYETEQLITAVTKITDLLRKCWGVAGADIISTNLATREGALTEVFNPTVPGKSVYALFGFAAINGFDHALRNLGGDIMILINDVAAVLHGEVFRWGFGESGQCNKNLGSAFLMVFRIGLVKEVVEKLEQAQDVIFNTGNTKASQTSASKKRHKHTTSGGSGGGGGGGGSDSTAPKSRPSATTHKSASMAKNAAAATIKRKIKRNASVKAMSLSLAQLPGISAFTDRAVIGMLKSFAGIYRDNKIRNWNNDFRLSAGVGTFTVSMIYGMDAGWAVEGAVGSEYKIDATYLSPHVNMASRMMSACKQYGVSMLLSQAVQELMSDVAQSKLRHLDTVTVKGSSVKQRIYTYDARPKGVDFFLYSRSDEQADFEADRYSTKSWHNDSDLKAMRQHVSEEFLDQFTAGRRAFLAGNWKEAIKRLERANELMIENALEDGYLEDEFEELAMRSDHARAAEELKLQNGDGPSLYLINFMKSKGGVAPAHWEGWHPLTSK